jgi:hypothetical protein
VRAAQFQLAIAPHGIKFDLKARMNKADEVTTDINQVKDAVRETMTDNSSR